MAVGSMRPENNTHELPVHRFSSYFITHTFCFSFQIHFLGLKRENRQGKGEISLPLPERDSANDVCLWRSLGRDFRDYPIGRGHCQVTSH